MNHILSVRELYCPSHFGNSYEVALKNEMRGIMSEAKSWGFNRFSDWFDTIDLYDVYHKKHNLFNMPETMWERKFQNYQIASGLGYELNLVITPNHVFSDQVTKENEAVKSDVFFGQLVCPSRPGVTEIILDNYRNLFSGFADRGLNLTAISAFSYDYGECACNRCRPWIVTFGRLTMAEADAEVRRHKEWNAARLKATQGFWDAKEYLYRYVWRLGLTRHVFKFDSYAPIWHKEFLAARGEKILPHKRINKKNSSTSDRLP